MRIMVEIDDATMARVEAYAERKGLPVRQAVTGLLDIGLSNYERYVKAGQARAAAMTPEERAKGLQARWGTKKASRKRKEPRG